MLFLLNFLPLAFGYTFPGIFSESSQGALRISTRTRRSKMAAPLRKRKWRFLRINLLILRWIFDVTPQQVVMSSHPKFSVHYSRLGSCQTLGEPVLAHWWSSFFSSSLTTWTVTGKQMSDGFFAVMTGVYELFGVWLRREWYSIMLSGDCVNAYEYCMMGN